MEIPRLELTAYHEAAHAVAQCRFGFNPLRVTIEPSGMVLGVAHSLDGWEDWVDQSPDECGRTGTIVSALAGYTAQIYRGDRRWLRARGMARDDFERARQALRNGETLKEWKETAAVFVAMNWPAITVVATELLEHETLDGEEVEVLVEFADGECTRDELEEFRVALHSSRSPSR